jgi:two-component sensor histidine kinase
MGIQQRIPEDLGWVRGLRSQVLEFVDDECGNAAEIRADVALAFTEACSNVARHAYPCGGGSIRVAARTEHGELVVVVSDEGVGLSETSPNPGGGFGLQLIQGLARTRISSDRGTEVEMRFPAASQNHRHP